MKRRVFVLSPAHSGGERAGMLLRGGAHFELAERLRGEGAPLGEVFAFISGLYFRGKLAYSEAFAAPPPGVPGALVIAPGRGLLPPAWPVTIDDMREMASVPVDAANPHYREPLERDARILAQLAGARPDVILLGSVATAKYIEPLLAIFGNRLLFPAAFAGRGDMSRGGLLLRAARSGIELEYAPVAGAARHGPRPPKLPRLR
jgi:hypothetical protein